MKKSHEKEKWIHKKYQCIHHFFCCYVPINIPFMNHVVRQWSYQFYKKYLHVLKSCQVILLPTYSCNAESAVNAEKT